MDFLPSTPGTNPNRRLYLTSRTRSNGTPDNFTVYLSNTQISPPPGRRLMIGLLDATIPGSWYNISSSTGLFKFRITIDAVDLDLSFSVPPGNWGANSLFIYLGEQMTILIQNADPTYGTIYGGFNGNTGKGYFYWVTTQAPNPVLTILGADVLMTIRTKVGFTTNVSTDGSITEPLATDYAIGDTLPSLSGPISVQVRSNDFAPNVWTVEDQYNSNILAIIPITSGAFQTTIYHNDNPNLNEVTSQISQITIKLTDERGQSIDFNGFDCDFHFGLYIV